MLFVSKTVLVTILRSLRCVFDPVFEGLILTDTIKRFLNIWYILVELEIL